MVIKLDLKLCFLCLQLSTFVKVFMVFKSVKREKNYIIIVIGKEERERKKKGVC